LGNTGRLPVFGYPITEQREEVIEGKKVQVQWFERNRFELHPENQRPFDVQLGRLGIDVLEKRGDDWNTFPKGTPQNGCEFFSETGHTVCDEFLKYWQTTNISSDFRLTRQQSLDLFGLPVSEKRTEMLSDGQDYFVQWFERARFESHNGQVALGLLGRDILEKDDPADICDTISIREPVNAVFNPPRCVQMGKVLQVSVFGFGPSEKIQVTQSAPDGTIRKKEVISIKGEYSEEIPTARLLPGHWYGVYNGIESKDHTASIYFYVAYTTPEMSLDKKMPQLVGKQKDDAIQELKAIDNRIEPIVDLQQKEGCVVYEVLSTNPPTGGSLSEQNIVLGVCSPPIMPDVIGMQRDVAETTLKAKGITYVIEETPDKPERRGEVWTTLPPPNAPIAPGTTVVLKVIVNKDEGGGGTPSPCPSGRNC